MFNDIDNVIKFIARVLFVLSIIVGGILILSDSERTIIYILTIIGGCISAILMYGFGEIITILDDINSKIVENK